MVGDKLASGGVRANFQVAGTQVTQEKWDKIWRTDEPEECSGTADAQTAGDVGSGSGESSSVSGS